MMHHHAMTTTMSMMNHSMMNHSTMNRNHTMPSGGGGHGGHGGGGHTGGTHGGINGHTGMQMWFFVGKNVTILFQEWDVNSTGGLVGSMIALFLMGILYEGLKVGREVLKRKASAPIVKRETYELNGGSCHKAPQPTVVKQSPRSIILSKLHFLQTFLHMAQVFLGYLLMLAFMTYNAWLCIAIILGAGSGYFLFGWNSVAVVDLGDHCF